MTKFKNNTIVIYDPGSKSVDPTMKIGESVLYLGVITNVPNHCAVAKRDGVVLWLVHPEDFRLPKESEL